jgi:hypothetical protein
LKILYSSAPGPLLSIFQLLGIYSWLRLAIRLDGLFNGQGRRVEASEIYI